MTLHRVFIMGFDDELCALLQALSPDQAVDTYDLEEGSETMEELHDCFEDYICAVFENRSAEMRRDILAVLCNNAMVDVREAFKLDDLLSTLILNKMQNNIPGFLSVSSAKLHGIDPLTKAFIITVDT